MIFRRKTYDVEWKEVSVSTGEKEIFSVERELCAVGGDETSWDSPGWRAGKSCGDD